LGAQANAITITWTVGIGLSAILASYFMLNENTKKWSEKKIIFISSVISFTVTGSLVFFLFYWGR
jgi:hypothetical protein